jgi:hypothetical protein
VKPACNQLVDEGDCFLAAAPEPIMKKVMRTCLLIVFLGNAAMLAGQQPTQTGVGEPIPESAALFQPASSLLSASSLVPALGSAEPRPDPVYLSHALAKDEHVKPWKRYALIGAVIGGAITTTYYHFEVAPNFDTGYGPSTGWGYVIYAIPGALVGGFFGAASAYRDSR